jgi:hypothetical protein
VCPPRVQIENNAFLLEQHGGAAAFEFVYSFMRQARSLAMLSKRLLVGIHALGPRYVGKYRVMPNGRQS